MQHDGSIQNGRRLLRLREVMARTGLGRSAIYARMAAGAFPKVVKMGASSAWVEDEIRDWIETQIAARDAQGGAA